MSRCGWQAICALLLVVSALRGHAEAEPLELTVVSGQRFQRIDHFGSSVGFNGQHIAENWSTAAVDDLARHVFSRAMDESGNPRGIGLSSWRVEIGAGTKQNDAIASSHRRTGCFLRPDGSYDWQRQPGLRYWVEQVEKYDVPVLIGYSNSPPIYFTKNGYGFSTKNIEEANLKPQHYDDFARFLARVAKHFEDEGRGFDYIAPVNEPQWDWNGKPGKARQEGSHWTNRNIYRLVSELNEAMFRAGVRESRILIPEAGSLEFLYGKGGHHTGQQLRFWYTRSDLYLGDKRYLAPYVAGHSYWTESTTKQLIGVRRRLADNVRRLRSVDFWQTEYSFLGKGYREGKDSVTETDGALWLAKVIHADLTIGQARAWQFWDSFSRGASRGKAQRYTLIACRGTDQYRPTKNLWALGQFSRFIRPGMVRVGIQRDQAIDARRAADTQMASAYVEPRTGRTVSVLINYAKAPRDVRLTVPYAPDHQLKRYITDKNRSLDQVPAATGGELFTLPARSITTLVLPARRSGNE